MEMVSLRFDNNVSEDLLQSLNQPHYTAEQLAELPGDMRDLALQRNEELRIHPVIAIHRWATEGSRTRRGGVIRHADTQVVLTLESGEEVRLARTGDRVEYPDGSSAAILSFTPTEHAHVAVVGSQLANGDEIIDTPQSNVFFVTQEGLPDPRDSVTLEVE